MISRIKSTVAGIRDGLVYGFELLKIAAKSHEYSMATSGDGGLLSPPSEIKYLSDGFYIYIRCRRTYTRAL